MKSTLLALAFFFIGTTNVSANPLESGRQFHPDFNIQKCVLDTSETKLVCHGRHALLNQTMFALVNLASNETTYLIAGKSLSDQTHPPFKDYAFQDFLGLVAEFDGSTVTIRTEINVRLRAFWTDIEDHRATNGDIVIEIGSNKVRANDFGYVPI